MDARDPDRSGRDREDEDERDEAQARKHRSSLRFEGMKGQDKPKKLGKKVPQKSLKEKRKEKKAKKASGGGTTF
jgi:hypothetical protein